MSDNSTQNLNKHAQLTLRSVWSLSDNHTQNLNKHAQLTLGSVWSLSDNHTQNLNKHVQLTLDSVWSLSYKPRQKTLILSINFDVYAVWYDATCALYADFVSRSLAAND